MEEKPGLSKLETWWKSKSAPAPEAAGIAFQHIAGNVGFSFIWVLVSLKDHKIQRCRGSKWKKKIWKWWGKCFWCDVNGNLNCCGNSLVRVVNVSPSWRGKNVESLLWTLRIKRIDRGTMLSNICTTQTGSAQNGRCQHQTMADYEQWCKCWFSPGKSCWLTPLFTLWAEDLPDRNLSYLSKEHNSWHLLTQIPMRPMKNTFRFICDSCRS